MLFSDANVYQSIYHVCHENFKFYPKIFSIHEYLWIMLHQSIWQSKIITSYKILFLSMLPKSKCWSFVKLYKYF